ncbi:hypothetical protein A3Q56_01909 [Intoshia linei]|uniref:Uncharacterized protein n=1 Tax=Intoshia linei TaxID=1819745 RepID=A0A177B7U0_9BILA|nr:hypothetical protein A3Q56_01909 [Intoshia linei]
MFEMCDRKNVDKYTSTQYNGELKKMTNSLKISNTWLNEDLRVLNLNNVSKILNSLWIDKDIDKSKFELNFLPYLFKFFKPNCEHTLITIKLLILLFPNNLVLYKNQIWFYIKEVINFQNVHLCNIAGSIVAIWYFFNENDKIKHISNSALNMMMDIFNQMGRTFNFELKDLNSNVNHLSDFLPSLNVSLDNEDSVMYMKSTINFLMSILKYNLLYSNEFVSTLNSDLFKNFLILFSTINENIWKNYEILSVQFGEYINVFFISSFSVFIILFRAFDTKIFREKSISQSMQLNIGNLCHLSDSAFEIIQTLFKFWVNKRYFHQDQSMVVQLEKAIEINDDFMNVDIKLKIRQTKIFLIVMPNVAYSEENMRQLTNAINTNLTNLIKLWNNQPLNAYSYLLSVNIKIAKYILSNYVTSNQTTNKLIYNLNIVRYFPLSRYD